MACVKLTPGMRAGIVRRLVDRALEADERALRLHGEALAEACYLRKYDEPTRRQMERLPAGFLETSTNVSVRLGTGGYASYANLTLARPLRNTHAGRMAPLELPSGDPLIEEHAQVREAREDLKKRRERLTAEARAVCDRVHTVGKLLATWPEVAPFVDAPAESPKPLVRVGELNRQLGLPVTAAEPA